MLKEIQKDLLEREIITPPPISWKACEDSDGKPRDLSSKSADDDDHEKQQVREKREERLGVSRMSFLISAYEPMYWWFELFGATSVDFTSSWVA